MKAIIELLPPEARRRRDADARGAGRARTRRATGATRSAEVERRPGTD